MMMGTAQNALRRPHLMLYGYVIFWYRSSLHFLENQIQKCGSRTVVVSLFL